MQSNTGYKGGSVLDHRSSLAHCQYHCNLSSLCFGYDYNKVTITCFIFTDPVLAYNRLDSEDYIHHEKDVSRSCAIPARELT